MLLQAALDSLVHVTTAVDHKGLSREKITFIAGKEKQGSDQILWLLKPAQRSETHIIFRNIVRDGSARLRVRETGSNGIHTNPMRA